MKTQELEKIVAASTFTPEQVALLKTTVAKDTTDDELALFMHVCKKSGLDPFARQIYAIKRKNRRSGKDEMTIQTGIDGYRVVAERTGMYAPGKEPSYVYDKDKRLVSATAYIHKRVGDAWFEVSATAFYSEYVQETNFIWQKMPHVMLSKCAEALALRRAFPNELSGVLTNEEMLQADGEENSVPMPKAKPKVDVIEAAQVAEPDDEPMPPAEDISQDTESPPPSADPMTGGKSYDPEAKIDRDTQKMLWAKVRYAKITEDKIKKTISLMWNIESTSDLKNKQLDTLVQLINKGAIK